MGLLVPPNFPLGTLKNRAERDAVGALVDRLSDGWYVIPSVGIFGASRDFEMDIVLVHERDGVAVLEVKGHRPEIVGGVWMNSGQPMTPQPLAQARDNAYELRDLLRATHPSLRKMQVAYGVIFPNAGELRGTLPPDVDRSQILVAADLEDPLDAVDRLTSLRWTVPVGAAGLRAIVDKLCPSAELAFDAEARARLLRLRLDELSERQVQALETLDMNRRVMVTGGAGTGKTRLAAAWARRARERGERVLFTCYNDPLGWDLQAREELLGVTTVGSFHQIAFTLPGMPELGIPEDADGAWWDDVANRHLIDHWDDVTARFDTIVVDEAQDFRPEWVTMLERLLDPDGPARMLMVADLAQMIYDRGFTMPSATDGWVRCDLTNNCRNSAQIATMLYRRLGGAVSPYGGPETIAVNWCEADDLDAAIDAVGEAIDEFMDDDDRDPENLLVLTTTRSVRDHLRESLGFTSWESADEGDIACETVHRAKGLEADHVILVTLTDDVSDTLLYIGISRAVTGLTVVSPRAVGERLGLTSADDEPDRTAQLHDTHESH